MTISPPGQKQQFQLQFVVKTQVNVGEHLDSYVSFFSSGQELIQWKLPEDLNQVLLQAIGIEK